MDRSDGERFLRTCRGMQRHWSGPKRVGRHWGRQADRMMQRIAAYPRAGLFSTRLSVLDAFGGGAMRPDAELMRPGPLGKIADRYGRLVRAFAGYGSVGDALLGPLARDEAVRRMLLYSSVNYENAVRAGAVILRDEIERSDVRSVPLFDEQLVDIDGRPLAWLTLASLRRVALLRDRVGPVGRTLEIGAGTGEFARLMLRTGTTRRYAIVDVPPALAFAQELIRADIPEAELDLFKADRAGVDLEARCIFLTPDQIAFVPQSELGVNVASFGEMPRALARGYIELAKRAVTAHFLSINAARPHPVVQAEQIDESFYMSTFAPEFRVRERRRWTESLELALPDAPVVMDGYLWLLFERSTAG